MRNLRIEEIKDEATRENFQKLEEHLDSLPIARGKWRFMEIRTGKAETNLKIPHGLGFKPLDVVQTSITGVGSVTWNYSRFDRTNIDITTTGACVIRALIGSLKEG